MLTPFVGGFGAEIIVRYGIAALILLIGVLIAWPSRPNLLRRRPIKVFLERDSGSNHIGIHSFPAVNYVQASVISRVPLASCKVWLTRVEYTPDGITPYSIEHNERHALPWSKAYGPNPLDVAINPDDPPIRFTVATFDGQILQLEPSVQTPTNLFNRLQRLGLHRFTITLVAERILKFAGLEQKYVLSKTVVVICNWRGPGQGAIVSLE
jgi:hypothetical protein